MLYQGASEGSAVQVEMRPPLDRICRCQFKCNLCRESARAGLTCFQTWQLDQSQRPWSYRSAEQIIRTCQQGETSVNFPALNSRPHSQTSRQVRSALARMHHRSSRRWLRTCDEHEPFVSLYRRISAYSSPTDLTFWSWDPSRMAHPARQRGATPRTMRPRLLIFIER